jgi:glycolate oxidase FAD binding subunit
LTVGEVWRPASAEAVLEVVRGAAADGTRLEIVGGGSRRRLGHAVAADQVLDVSGLAGITLYEPRELVLTARPGTPIPEIEALTQHGQRLAFEPPDLGPLWGAPAGLGSLGGAVAVGLGGPRRPSAGAPRDHLLGFKAVNGFGEAFAAGGRVVKNVTGFDLPKLMAGSFGTLGVMTEVTVKVLPAPAAERTLMLGGLDDAAGLTALRTALSSPYPASGAAHLPAEAAARMGLPGGAAATLIRLEGVSPGIAAAEAGLTEALGLRAGGFARIEREESHALWRGIGGAAAFAGSEAPVWRICPPPASAARLGEALRAAGVARLFYDWGGGLIWTEGPDDADGGAAAVRGALAGIAGEGHATLVRAPDGLDASLPRFQPLAPGVARLTARIKARFDPLGLFNPGRMGEAG